MEIRFQASPKEVKGMSTEELRSNFLIQQLMQLDTLRLVYSHFDRVIIGGVKPAAKKSAKPAPKAKAIKVKKPSNVFS